MKTASTSEIEAHFHTYLEECEETPIVVTRDGKPVAVLLPVMADEELESLLLAYNSSFWRMLDTATRRIEQTGGIEHEEFWQAVEKEP